MKTWITGFICVMSAIAGAAEAASGTVAETAPAVVVVEKVPVLPQSTTVRIEPAAVRPASSARTVESSTAPEPRQTRVVYQPRPVRDTTPSRPMTVERRSASPGSSTNRLRPNLPGLR